MEPVSRLINLYFMPLLRFRWRQTYHSWVVSLFSLCWKDNSENMNSLLCQEGEENSTELWRLLLEKTHLCEYYSQIGSTAE